MLINYFLVVLIIKYIFWNYYYRKLIYKGSIYMYINILLKDVVNYIKIFKILFWVIWVKFKKNWCSKFIY